MKIKKITLATTSWQPYFGSELKDGGYFVVISREAFKRVGYDLKVEFMPWKRALVLAKNKDRYDGLLGAYYSDERTQHFKYSDPIDKTEVVLMSKKHKKISYKKLSDLKKYKIGIVRGYINSEEFDKADYLQKYEAYSTDQNIKLLIFDRVDLIVDAKKVVIDTIRKKYPQYIGKVTALNPPLSTRYLYNAFNKNIRYKNIVEEFNKGLKEVKKDGTFDRILKSYKF